MTHLLRTLDVYTYKMQIKCSFVGVVCDVTIVTSNLHPRDWYKWTNREEQYSALARRFTRVVVYGVDGPAELTDEREIANYFSKRASSSSDSRREERIETGYQYFN